MILSEEFFIVDAVLKKIKKYRTDSILKISFFLKTTGTNKQGQNSLDPQLPSKTTFMFQKSQSSVKWVQDSVMYMYLLPKDSLPLPPLPSPGKYSHVVFTSCTGECNIPQTWKCPQEHKAIRLQRKEIVRALEVLVC